MEARPACLFITASSAACGGEVRLIRDVLNNVGIDLREIEWISEGDFQSQVCDSTKYQIIYLGAHADSYGFGETDGHSLTAWENLGTVICQADCILPGGTLFLGCCRGGMKTVALKILKLCDRIDYICGPNWKVTGNDITAAFQAFIQSWVRKKEEPRKAAERASEAAGFGFSCYDRQELQSEIETLRQIRNIEMDVQEIRDWKESLSQQIASLHADIVRLLPPNPTDQKQNEPK
jgi:hypothetical protein